VLQELILSTDAVLQPELERIIDRLKLLPEDPVKAMALAGRAFKEMPEPAAAPRNRLPHPNDIIVASSAGDCDFLVTNNSVLKDLIAGPKPRTVTVSELVARLRNE
jgi:hypothetical protein